MKEPTRLEREVAGLREKVENLERVLDRVLAAVKEHGTELGWLSNQVNEYPHQHYRSSDLPNSVYPISKRFGLKGD